MARIVARISHGTLKERHFGACRLDLEKYQRIFDISMSCACILYLCLCLWLCQWVDLV